MDGGHRAVTLNFWSGPYGKMFEYDLGRGSGPVRLRPMDRTADGQRLWPRAADGATWTVMLSKGVLLLQNGGVGRAFSCGSTRGRWMGAVPHVFSASLKEARFGS